MKGPHTTAAARRNRRSRQREVPIPRDMGFFFDIDGTLVDFADAPSKVRVDRALVRLLGRLRDAAGGAVALISGRSVADIDRLFGPARFCVAGQHGAERRDAAGMLHRLGSPSARLREVGRKLERLAVSHPSLVLEDKGMNLALHYRRAPRLGSKVRAAVRKLARELGDAFEVQNGKMVIEIKPSGRDKGTAIAEFMREKPFRHRLPVFVGDDRTDEFGFRVVNRLGGLSVKVGKGRTAARRRLPDTAAVRDWLAQYASAPSPARKRAGPQSS